MRFLGLTALASILGFAGVYGFTQPGGIVLPVSMSGCVIKGNISYNSGERIYHMPGQHWYGDTVIDPQKGERWFCTEAEARAAGWRKAGD